MLRSSVARRGILGVTTVKFCTECGNQVGAKHKFCASCGEPVAPTTVPQPAADEFTPDSKPVVVDDDGEQRESHSTSARRKAEPGRTRYGIWSNPPPLASSWGTAIWVLFSVVVFLIAIAAIELLIDPVSRDDLLDSLYFYKRRYLTASAVVPALFLFLAVIAWKGGTSVPRKERLAFFGSLGLICLVAAGVVYGAVQPYDPYRGLSDAEIAVLDVMYEFDSDLRRWDSDDLMTYPWGACYVTWEDEPEATEFLDASSRVVDRYREQVQRSARYGEVYAFALQAITDLYFLEPEPVSLCDDELRTLAVTYAVAHLRDEWIDRVWRGTLEEGDLPLRFYPEG